jgi:outer membrane protein assembly factor BamB
VEPRALAGLASALIFLAAPATAHGILARWVFESPLDPEFLDVAALDVNGDGVPDAIGMSRVPEDVWWLEGLLGAKRGAVVAVDGRTGGEVWRHELEGSPTALAIGSSAGSPRVFVASHAHPGERSILTLLDPTSGLPTTTSSSVEGFARSILVEDFSGDGIDEVALGILGNPFVFDHQFFGDRVVVIDGSLLALGLPVTPSASAPFLRWQSEVAGWIIDPDGLCAKDYSGDGLPDLVAIDDFGQLNAFRGTDGALLWRHDLGIGTGGSVRCEEEVLVPYRHQLLAFDGDGGLAWSSGGYAFILSRIGGPVAPLGITSDTSGTAVGFDARTGEVVWRTPLHPGFNHEPFDIRSRDAASCQGMTVLSYSKGAGPGFALHRDPGVLTVLDTSSGAVVRDLELSRSALRIALPCAEHGPDIYAASISGRMYAFNMRP